MFEEIGKKIKSLAWILCWLGIGASIITSIAMFIMVEEVSYYEEGLYKGLGFAFLFAGPLISWVNSLLIYGFGELVDKACNIESYLRNMKSKPLQDPIFTKEKVDEISKLFSQGLITEEEYQRAISKYN